MRGLTPRPQTAFITLASSGKHNGRVEDIYILNTMLYMLKPSSHSHLDIHSTHLVPEYLVCSFCVGGMCTLHISQLPYPISVMSPGAGLRNVASTPQANRLFGVRYITSTYIYIACTCQVPSEQFVSHPPPGGH